MDVKLAFLNEELKKVLLSNLKECDKKGKEKKVYKLKKKNLISIEIGTMSMLLILLIIDFKHVLMKTNYICQI